jgi:hypothetical protein
MRTQHFQEPIIRIGIDKARFPNVCPICGRPAHRPSKIYISPHSRRNPRDVGRSAVPRLLASGTRALLIYVCDEHYQSDDGRNRGRILCTLANALMISLLVFEIMWTGGDIAYGRPISPLLILVISLLILGLSLSYPTFRAGELESSVRIVGFDAAFSNVWLDLKQPEFRSRFTEENAAQIEFVRWIRKI